MRRGGPDSSVLRIAARSLRTCGSASGRRTDDVRASTSDAVRHTTSDAPGGRRVLHGVQHGRARSGSRRRNGHGAAGGASVSEPGTSARGAVDQRVSLVSRASPRRSGAGRDGLNSSGGPRHTRAIRRLAERGRASSEPHGRAVSADRGAPWPTTSWPCRRGWSTYCWWSCCRPWSCCCSGGSGAGGRPWRSASTTTWSASSSPSSA